MANNRPGRHLLEALAVAYRHGATARAQGLSPAERLRLQQNESGPPM